MTRSGSDPSAAAAEADLRRLFGFDLDAETWVAHVRACNAGPRESRFGAYELIAEIGRGGQGIVYRARQPGTGREVALKRPAAGVFATPQMRARFEREVEAVASLDHPHIVTVYGTEIIDDQPVLAMQWVEGRPFDQWARPPQGPPRDLDTVLSTFLRLCEAIEHAHQRGVIHRDLKPTNVLVDADDQPHVLDFGLAKLLAVAVESDVTRTGEFLGTPAWAAPEQVRGDPRAIDVRTDVYALGMLLYQALAGRLPFEQTDSVQQLLQRIQHEVPAAPSRFDVRLDRELDAIVLKALAKDNRDRYASVAALAEDIQRYRAGETVHAHPPSRVYRARKFVRRHRLSVTVASVFVALLLAATATSTTFYRQAVRQRDRAAAEAARADLVAGQQIAINDLLRGIILTADPGNTQGRTNLTIQEAVVRMAEVMTSPPEKYTPLVKAAVHMALGELFLNLSQYKQAEAHFLSALEIRRGQLHATDPEILSALHYLGRAYRHQGHYADAEQIHREVVALRRQRAAAGMRGEELHLAQALSSLAITLRTLARYDEAESATREALELYRAGLGDANENVAIQMGNLANILTWRGAAAEAEPVARRAVELFRALHGPGPHSETARALLALAEALWATGQVEEAETVSRETVQMFQTLYTAPHEGTSAAQHALGTHLAGQGRFDEAQEQLEAALEARRHVFGDEHPLTRATRDELERLQVASAPRP